MPAAGLTGVEGADNTTIRGQHARTTLVVMAKNGDLQFLTVLACVIFDLSRPALEHPLSLLIIRRCYQGDTVSVTGVESIDLVVHMRIRPPLCFLHPSARMPPSPDCPWIARSAQEGATPSLAFPKISMMDQLDLAAVISIFYHGHTCRQRPEQDTIPSPKSS